MIDLAIFKESLKNTGKRGTNVSTITVWWPTAKCFNFVIVQSSISNWCWFSSLLREVFLQVLRFSPLSKNHHFQIPIRSGAHEHVLTSFWPPKWFVGKQITFTRGPSYVKTVTTIMLKGQVQEDATAERQNSSSNANRDTESLELRGQSRKLKNWDKIRHRLDRCDGCCGLHVTRVRCKTGQFQMS